MDDFVFLYVVLYAYTHIDTIMFFIPFPSDLACISVKLQ